ncbi:MAG: IS66 family insertion sequence element accessory protein TnpB [Chloroflexota bacterium]|nr:IS66 family insertion sequence element accessory protein TnpB [Gammaproteobacteria bacterium]MDE2669057.1 IS66 family insertion sequence element accessory protein TnpB [Chloroflexota bacterium]
MSDEKRAVVRRSRAEWQAILSRFERSGQGRREFCEAEGLVLGTFSWWRTQLGRSGAGGTAAGGALFVELADGRPAEPAWDAELDLGGGMVLRVRRPPC